MCLRQLVNHLRRRVKQLEPEQLLSTRPAREAFGHLAAAGMHDLAPAGRREDGSWACQRPRRTVSTIHCRLRIQRHGLGGWRPAECYPWHPELATLEQLISSYGLCCSDERERWWVEMADEV